MSEKHRKQSIGAKQQICRVLIRKLSRSTSVVRGLIVTFSDSRLWAEGGLELVDNLLLLQPALPHPRNKTICYPLHILGVPW